MMQPWKKVSEKVLKLQYKTIVTKLFIMPDGREAPFEIWGVPGCQCVAIIALTKDNRVVIARQYRPGPEKVFEELPGGNVDKDEDLAVAAARELYEETGYETNRPLVYLGQANRDAYSYETSNYFVAYDCEQTTREQKLDLGEFVDIDTITIDELIDNAKHNRSTDAVAVLMAYDLLMEIRSKEAKNA